MLKNSNYLLLVSSLIIPCALYSLQIDESLIESPARLKQLPQQDIKGIWESYSAQPLENTSSVHELLNTSLLGPDALTLNALFGENSTDVFLTVPTAFSNTCKTHVGDFIRRYDELKYLGIENICIFSHDTPQILALWKLALFIQHSAAPITQYTPSNSTLSPQALLQAKFKKFRFVSLQEPSKGVDNEFAAFLGITNFSNNGLGESYRRSAGIVRAQKVMYHSIQNHPRCTTSSCAERICSSLRINS